MNQGKELKLIKQILICLGMLPVRLSSQTNYLYFLPMLTHFLIDFLIVHAVLTYPERFFITSSSIQYLIDCVQVFRAFITVTIQILENILKTRIDDEINESIEAIDDEIFARHFCRNIKSCSFCRRRSLKFVFYSRILIVPVTCILIDLTLMAMVSKTYTLWSENLYIREFSVGMIRMGIVQIACNFHWVCDSLTFSSDSMIDRIEFFEAEESIAVCSKRIGSPCKVCVKVSKPQCSWSHFVRIDCAEIILFASLENQFAFEWTLQLDRLCASCEFILCTNQWSLLDRSTYQTK